MKRIKLLLLALIIVLLGSASYSKIAGAVEDTQLLEGGEFRSLIRGPAVNSQAGYNGGMAMGDLDGDGQSELAIGASANFSASGHTEDGAVYPIFRVDGWL